MNVQIPKELGGVHGEALFVDTHGDFAIERVIEMAKGLRTSVLKKLEKEPALLKKYKEEFSVDRILQRIKYARLLDENQQTIFHNRLEQDLKTVFTKTRLVVIDTFSEHMRLSEVGYQERKKQITQTLMKFLELGQKYQVCFVLVNNMKSAKKDFLQEVSGAVGPGIAGLGIGNQGGGLVYQQSKPEPMFGEDLFQCVTNRIMLERELNTTEENIFKGRLVKGSVAHLYSSSAATSHFQVTEKGINTIM